MQESNSAAARVARQKFESRIERGRASGARIIQKIMEEVPTDYIAKGKILNFNGNEEEREPGSPWGLLMSVPSILVGEESSVFSVHKWAEQQICGRASLPWKYAQYLEQGDIRSWGLPLLATNLNTLYSKSRSKYLLRTYKGTVRGFLSDRYKRLDSRPLIESFSGACKDVGAVPIDGFGTDTKVGLTAVLPKIYEPVENEPISMGVTWENSDYGNGRHMINGFIDRAWCANGIIMSMGFAQVHLGKRLTDDIVLSERTHQLDTMATASAIDDVVRKSLSQEMVDLFCETVKTAHEEKIDVEKALKNIRKQLTKGEVELIKNKFNSPDVEMLPPGNTSWRLSNAISWVAGNDIEDEERKNDLQKVAGQVIAATMAVVQRRRSRLL